LVVAERLIISTMLSDVKHMKPYFPLRAVAIIVSVCVSDVFCSLVYLTRSSAIADAPRDVLC